VPHGDAHKIFEFDLNPFDEIVRPMLDQYDPTKRRRQK
jgi:hypothetical protein